MATVVTISHGDHDQILEISGGAVTTHRVVSTTTTGLAGTVPAVDYAALVAAVGPGTVTAPKAAPKKAAGKKTAAAATDKPKRSRSVYPGPDRVREAIETCGEGATLTALAVELGTTPVTVKKWIDRLSGE